MSRRKTWTVLAGLVLLLAAPVGAQQRRPPAGAGMERGEMERRVQQRFAEMVRVQLGLDQAAARSLGEVVRSFQDERQALLVRERRLRVRLGRGPLADAPRRRVPLLPDGEAREVLGEMARLREAEADLYRREEERLLEVLSPGQLVRFYVLREEMAERLGRFRGGAPGRPGGGPAARGPGGSGRAGAGPGAALPGAPGRLPR